MPNSTATGNPPCPFCGSPTVKFLKYADGAQRYRCKNEACFRCSDGTDSREPRNNNPACPHCGERRLVKTGTYADGSQRYNCGACHKSSDGINTARRTRGPAKTNRERCKEYYYSNRDELLAKQRERDRKRRAKAKFNKMMGRS